MAKAVSQRVKRKEKKNITAGVAHVNSTFNNTRVTITDAQGNTVSWSTSGAQGLKVPVNLPLMQPRLPPKMPAKRRRSTV